MQFNIDKNLSIAGKQIASPDAQCAPLQDTSRGSVRWLSKQKLHLRKSPVFVNMVIGLCAFARWEISLSQSRGHPPMCQGDRSLDTMLSTYLSP